MDVTPPDLKNGPRNIYSQIAIALKGAELREVGLANLAGRLVARVARAPIAEDRPSARSSQTGGIALASVESSV